MYTILKTYVTSFPENFSQANPEHFSPTDMSLLSLSHSLHNLSLISKEFQEVDYTPDFVSNLDSKNQESIFDEAVRLHKMLSHFILSNMPEDNQ